MRKTLLSCLALGLAFAGATLLPALTPPPVNDEQQILTIEREACDAYLHADADYLDRLLTDDFSAINGRAEMNNKADELKEVRDKAVHYTVFENRDMQVHRHGDTAVVIGITTVKGALNDGKPFAIEVRFTDVFTKIDGKWRMVAGHSSRIPQKEA